ncbi:MAG: hypothetical protein GYA55_03275 [SAR324 cluster bacterium]|uniref:Uncharacterized protein n=1 Tax=SAR324 cluster bacterium TaxID=2024889 RepID=A0A7X9FPW8_9DELT|nr:hypothetical protein [SAR324 cluster bacterium]
MPRSVIDAELDAKWREGLSDEQYSSLQAQLDANMKVEIPQGLRERLLNIPKSVRAESVNKEKFWPMPLYRFVPATLLLGIVALGTYYLNFDKAAIPTDISVQANQYLQAIIDDDFSEDIFDEDLAMMELLS